MPMQVTKCDVQNAGCNRMYQKMCINFPEKGVCYVAIEAKVFKYDHVINFAKFLVKDKVASLVSSSSISISYEYDDTEVTPLGPIGEEELNAMIPPGCDTVNKSENTSDIDDYEDPQKMFEYEFESCSTQEADSDGQRDRVQDPKDLLHDCHDQCEPTDGMSHR